MTKITIHGQKMQFHKKVAISVTLTSGTGGTATFFPETGTSYTLSSLPIGSKIAKAASSLYVITNSSGTTLGSISLSESPGYEISDCDIVRGGVHVAISNTTLEDGDTITAIFKALDMPLYVNVQWLTQSHGTAWNFVTVEFDGATVNPNMMPLFINYNCDTGAYGFNNDGSEISAKFYNASQEIFYNTLYCTVNDSNYIIQRIEYYDAESGSRYTCDFGGPQMPPIPLGTEGGQFTIYLEQSVTCSLVDYQTAGLPSPYALDGSIETAVRNIIQDISEMHRKEPNKFGYILMDQDGIYGFCRYDCIYRTTDQRGNPQYVNSQIYVAFYQHSSNTVAMPYELTQASQHQVMPLWTETHLPNPNYINSVFTNGDEHGLNNWMADWNCRGICDFTDLIKDLAEYHI